MDSQRAGKGGSRMELDWLDDGRLYILLPDRLLGEWHGIDSADYDRAC